MDSWEKELSYEKAVPKMLGEEEMKGEGGGERMRMRRERL